MYENNKNKMDKILKLDQTCSQLNLSYCRHIGKPPFYTARTLDIHEDISIASFSTVVLLIIIIFSLLRVHMHIHKKFVASARAELMLACDLYIFSLILELLLCTELFKAKFLVILQLGISSSIFAVLLWMSIYSTMLEMVHSFSKVRFFTAVHFLIIISLALIFFNSPVVVFLIGIVSIAYVFLFFFIQTIKLKINRAELWPYGNLIIGFMFFSFGCTLFFIGNEIISFLCNGYLDGLFIIHTMFFLSFLMLHKFWLSTCDFEIECATV